MNDKLSLQDLAEILSRQAQIERKDADLFYREFFQLILEKIYENDSVKVKDFGTFKLTAINSRESVDVNTGDKIEIPAHYRFTFLPDKTLKELVNKPFAKYQTVLLEDGMDPNNINFELLDEDADDSDEGGMDDNEVSKIIQEQAKLIEEIQIKNSIRPTTTSESASTKTFSKIDLIGKSKEKIKPKEVVTRPTVKPFVYTYSTTSSSEKKENDVIMMTVRKDRISKIGVDKPTSDIPLSDKNIHAETGRYDNSELNEIHAISSDKNSRTTNLTVASTVNVPSTPLKEIDDDLIDINTTFNLPISDIDSSLENDDIESSIMFSESIKLDQETQKLDDEDFSNLNTDQIKSRSFVTKNYFQSTKGSTNDPNRPLIPEDIDEDNSLISGNNLEQEPSSIEPDQIDIDTAFAEIGDNSASDLSDSVQDHVRSTDINNSNNSSLQEDEVIDPFFDYESKTTKQSKLKKILPIVLLILALLIVLGYNVYKLLNVKDDFERYHSVESDSFTMLDSFPSLYEDKDNATASLVKSDSVKINSYADTLSEENAVVVDVAPILDKDTASRNNNYSAINSVSNTSATTKRDSVRNAATNLKKESRQISENLSINIANKGKLFVQKLHSNNNIADLMEDQINSVKSTPVEDFKVKSDTSVRLTSGMTLRSLASKYYGNADYWVYIYTANKNKLPNPNSITIGVSLVIPRLKEFGISNPKDPTQLAKAKRLEYEILK